MSWHCLQEREAAFKILYRQLTNLEYQPQPQILNMNAIALDILIVIAAAATYMAGWLVFSQYMLWALAIIAALQLLSFLMPLLFAAALWMGGACASLYSKIVNRKS